jgi:hypothetical protein
VIAAPKGATYTAVAKLLQPDGIVAAVGLQPLSMLSHRD